MGAVLVCFGDHEPDFSEIRQQRGRSPSEDSLLDRLHKNWSCGEAELDEDDDPVNWDAFLLQSTRSTASSGSRMLSAVYSRVLEENDDCAFFFDSRGRRVKGAYLDRLELVDDYFLPSGRRRSSSSATPPPLESLEIYSSSEDCFSTSSTVTSELDYWATSDSERRYDWRYLPQRPVFARCSSLGSPVHSGLKIHRATSSQEDACIARFQSPWSSPRSKLGSRQFPSPRPFLPSGAGLAALTAS